MSKLTANHILDPETLAKMNAEFLAGAYDKLDFPEIPALDPASDPFERNFEWLNEPQGAKTESNLSLSRKRPEGGWSKEAGRVVRQLALGGSLAGSNDSQIFRKWVEEGFYALCLAAGAKGEEALMVVRSTEKSSDDRVEFLSRWLATQPQFKQRTEEERLTVAIAAVEHFSNSPP